MEDEFIAKYGDCEELDSADFDFVSKARQRAKGGKDGDLMCQYKVTRYAKPLNHKHGAFLPWEESRSSGLRVMTREGILCEGLLAFEGFGSDGVGVDDFAVNLYSFRK